MNARRAVVQTILAATILPLGCRSDSPNAGVENERQNLMEWVDVPGCSISSAGQIERHGQVATATWVLSIPLTWGKYRERLHERKLGLYRETAFEESAASFTRSTSGDVYLLNIEVVSAGPPIQARFTFTAMSN